MATIEMPADAGGFTTAEEVIEENCLPFTRLGLRLNKPVASGKLRMTFRPVV